jgi:murein DD-endopeptidase MepM/ murein hydrolase activator NlpD
MTKRKSIILPIIAVLLFFLWFTLNPMGVTTADVLEGYRNTASLNGNKAVLRQYLSNQKAQLRTVELENERAQSELDAEFKGAFKPFVELNHGEELVLNYSLGLNPPAEFNSKLTYGGAHTGCDFVVSGGQESTKGRVVLSPVQGTVTTASLSVFSDFGGADYGNYITIDAGAFSVQFAHLAGDPSWKNPPGVVTSLRGKAASQGTPLGRIGSTGKSTGYHLHVNLTVQAQGMTRYYSANDVLVKDISPAKLGYMVKEGGVWQVFDADGNPVTKGNDRL